MTVNQLKLWSAIVAIEDLSVLIGDKKDELNMALSQHESLNTFLIVASNAAVTFSQMDAALKVLEAAGLTASDGFLQRAPRGLDLRSPPHLGGHFCHAGCND